MALRRPAPPVRGNEFNLCTSSFNIYTPNRSYFKSLRVPCLLLVVLTLCVCVLLPRAAAISCTLTSKGGWNRAACVASCMAQNCATGYCTDKGICVCSRCAVGPPFTPNPGVPPVPRRTPPRPARPAAPRPRRQRK